MKDPQLVWQLIGYILAGLGALSLYFFKSASDKTTGLMGEINTKLDISNRAIGDLRADLKVLSIESKTLSKTVDRNSDNIDVLKERWHKIINEKINRIAFLEMRVDDLKKLGLKNTGLNLKE